MKTAIYKHRKKPAEIVLLVGFLFSFAL